jgi:hypothetical protein
MLIPMEYSRTVNAGVGAAEPGRTSIASQSG